MRDLNITEPICQVEGSGATLTLYRHKITIHKKSILSSLTAQNDGGQDIWIDSIASVRLKKPNLLQYGYIQITPSGNHQGGILSANVDKNAVWFGRGKWEEFSHFKDMLEQAMLDQRSEGRTSGSRRGRWEPSSDRRDPSRDQLEY